MADSCCADANGFGASNEGAMLECARFSAGTEIEVVERVRLAGGAAAAAATSCCPSADECGCIICVQKTIDGPCSSQKCASIAIPKTPISSMTVTLQRLQA